MEAFDVLEACEIVDVSCGAYHSLFLTDAMDVISCGQNQNGQCGFDPDECEMTAVPFKVSSLSDAQINGISAGEYHSMFLSVDGSVYTSGSNSEM
jgi:regulator of chromosome condensation